MTKQVIKVYIEVDSIADYEHVESLMAALFPKKSYISTEQITKTLKQLEDEEDS